MDREVANIVQLEGSSAVSISTDGVDPGMVTAEMSRQTHPTSSYSESVFADCVDYFKGAFAR